MVSLKIRKLIGRLMVYFDTGHQIWWKPISFITNITVIYVLLFTQFPFLYQIFPTIIHFAFIFCVGFILGMVIFGAWWMNRSGIYGGGMDVRFKTIPFFAELMEEVKTINKRLDGIDNEPEMLSDGK